MQVSNIWAGRVSVDTYETYFHSVEMEVDWALSM